MDSRDIKPIVLELERINKNLKRLADLFEKMNRQKQQEAQNEDQRSETE